MTTEFVILVLVIVTALGFDFTNGFHDTGNAMATSIATGALRPKVAVALSGILNLVGAFLSVEVALTVTNAVIKIQDKQGHPLPEMAANHGQPLLMIVLAGLVGGIVWNLLTWLLGLPSSSSHALFGGLIGAGIAALGFGGGQLGRQRDEARRCGRQGDSSGRPVAGGRLSDRDRGHLGDLPDHRPDQRRPACRRFPLGTDR